MSVPLAIGKYPKAILHIDGDAFFASCEQARNPELRGKPVITGKERGIASSMSYEAKRLGVTRGMRLFEIKKLVPDCIILPSDYETYSLLSLRFYEIIRRYTPDVEEYGIDECFADLTGWQRPLKMNYRKIAEKIQADLERELGFTFSIGLASTKVLAKIGSKWKKPLGLTCIPNREIHTYLGEIAVEKLWGIGQQSANLLNRLGVYTALEFARHDEVWVKRYFAKPQYEIWQELNGKSVMELQTKIKDTYYSIQKMKTFTPPSKDPTFVFAQLCKNIESACIKARRYSLEAKKVLILLKTQDFRLHSMEVTLTRPTNFSHEIIDVAKPIFDQLFQTGIFYRGTMIGLLELSKQNTQADLFGESVRVDKYRQLYAGIDKLAKKHGKHTVRFGSSFLAHQFGNHLGGRGDEPERKTSLMKGETKRKRLGIPTFTATLE